MNQEEINNLLDLYEQGLTSSEQEAMLTDHLAKAKDEEHLWFKFLKYRKKQKPRDIENQIWSSIQKEEKKKSRIILRAISVAASVALIISILWVSNPFKPKEMSYEEKAAVLKEALAMISSAEKTETNQDIIYEDETIIIYTER